MLAQLLHPRGQLTAFHRRRPHPANNPLPIVDEEHSEYECSSKFLYCPSTPVQADPDSSIRACLKLLCSSDLDQNRLGLQRLKLLTKGRTVSGLFQSETLASYVLIYGGDMGSFQEALRYMFATTLCDSPHQDTRPQSRMRQTEYEKQSFEDDDFSNASTNPYLDEDYLDTLEDCTEGIRFEIPESLLQRHDNTQKIEDRYGIGQDDDDSDSSWSSGTESEHNPQGKAWGALHSSALQVLVNALTFVDVATKHKTMPIPLHDTVWRNILSSLVHNIENNHTAEITGHSLKILRLLYGFHPELVRGLLGQSLFPHLVFLSEHYQDDQRFQTIHHEASLLLKKLTEDVPKTSYSAHREGVLIEECTPSREAGRPKCDERPKWKNEGVYVPVVVRRERIEI